VNTTQRDGFGQQAVVEGIAPYNPNSLGRGCPFPAGANGFVSVPREVAGTRARVRAPSFSDHFSQATLFWRSMSDTEREHIVGAFSFELGKCLSEDVKDRVLANLAHVDAELTKLVAANLGKAAPKGKPAKDIAVSPSLSLMPSAPSPVTGRVVGVMATDGVDDAGLRSVSRALTAAGALVIVIAPHGGAISGTTGSVNVDKSAMTTQSVEYDALVVAGGSGTVALGNDPYTALNLDEAFRHYKPIGAWGEGRDILEASGIQLDAAGVVCSHNASRVFAQSLLEALGWHRHWGRVSLPS